LRCNFFPTIAPAIGAGSSIAGIRVHPAIVDSAGFKKLPEFPPKTNTINCADTKVLLLVDRGPKIKKQAAMINWPLWRAG
jgi:hypothetical protein